MGRPRKNQESADNPPNEEEVVNEEEPTEDPQTSDEDDFEDPEEVESLQDSTTEAKVNPREWTNDYNLLLPFDRNDPLCTNGWLKMVEQLAERYNRTNQLVQIGLNKLTDKARVEIIEMGIPDTWVEFKMRLKKSFDPEKELKRIRDSILSKSRYIDMAPKIAVQCASKDQFLFEKNQEDKVMNWQIIQALGAAFKPEVWMSLTITTKDTFDQVVEKLEQKISAAQLMDQYEVNSWVNSSTVQAYHTQTQSTVPQLTSQPAPSNNQKSTGKKSFNKFQKGKGKGAHARIDDLEAKQDEMLKIVKDLQSKLSHFQ
ncbi:hypothetical protein H4219_005395 [Mycoemilia scoparia]|uniref:Uncharacterized protein n=1 Tax=Mycoemilia scoparia TaxID=417184 RepID=A0A9W7ZN53_9FUNG|nr:hypothetical protein H4219_005395 [Mycoemilia scoparia]